MAEPDQRPWERHYRIADTQIIAETPTLRVLEVTLAAGEEVPWHLHREVEDIFYCIEGGIEILTRKPAKTVRLAVGETTRVPPGRAHRVVNSREGTTRFLLVQGPGTYDYVPVPGDAGL